MRFSIVCLFLFISIHSAEIMAQQDSSQICESSCCNNEVALPAGVMLGHVHSKGEWMLSYRYMNMAMKGIYQGNSSGEPAGNVSF